MKHGYSTKPHYLYKLWADIKQRCYNSKCPAFKDYGMRGISMRNQWVEDFVSFKNYIEEYLGERPEGTSLDRINNDGDYVPGNIRWATRIQQNKNKRKRSITRVFSDGRITTYESMTEVVEDGFDRSHIYDCINGKRKTHKGSRWIKGGTLSQVL